jgi:hypothetical protein
MPPKKKTAVESISYSLTIFHTDGTKTSSVVQKKPKLKDYQNAVGGNIEMWSTDAEGEDSTDGDGTVYCNEEGGPLCLNLPPNPFFAKGYGDFVHVKKITS